MALSVSQVAALRRLARVYRRILTTAVPVTLAACQAAGDPMAPDAGAPADIVAPAADVMAAAAGTTGRIAYTFWGGSSFGDIWTMGPAGGNKTRLTSFTEDEARPTWSPDHQRIAFQRHRNGIYDIYLMNADGTNKHWVRPVRGDYPVTSPSWAPDGSHLLVELWIDHHSYLCRLMLATGNLELLAPAAGYGVSGLSPIYGKDGHSIYYMTFTGNQLRRFTPNGADVLVHQFSYFVSDLALSPDGNKLAFYSYSSPPAEGKQEIYVLNLSTDAVKRLTNNGSADVHPAWSPTAPSWRSRARVRDIRRSTR